MSPEYLKGIRRILTVSADTELVSAPAYLRAAQHAPALNNFGSAVSISRTSSPTRTSATACSATSAWT